MLIELAAVGMQGYKQAYLDTELFGPFQQCIGGTSEEFIEQVPVVGKGGPEFIGHGEDDVLPFAVGQDVLLLSNSLLGGFHATGAAAFAFTTLAEVFGVRTVGRSASIPANSHGLGPAGEHPLDDQFGPFGDCMAVFSE
ncbi:hypothetical protein V1951_22490 [Yersinia sp. 2544 StPb PI]